ncbi:unnamed protein product, partial [Pylaiella littoralis]
FTQQKNDGLLPAASGATSGGDIQRWKHLKDTRKVRSNNTTRGKHPAQTNGARQTGHTEYNVIKGKSRRRSTRSAPARAPAPTSATAAGA